MRCSLPISAFVAAGFEHSVANMYLVPIGLSIKAGAPGSFWADIGKTPAAFPTLTWTGFLWKNLLPVTIGNVIGASLVVSLAYWLALLRHEQPREERITQREIESAPEPAA